MYRTQHFPNIPVLVPGILPPHGTWGSATLQSFLQVVLTQILGWTQGPLPAKSFSGKSAHASSASNCAMLAKSASSRGLGYLICKIQVLNVLRSEALTFWKHHACKKYVELPLMLPNFC